MTEITPLDKKINGYDPITQIVVRGDVKLAVQQLKERIHELHGITTEAHSNIWAEIKIVFGELAK